MATTPGEYMLMLVEYNLATIATTKILGQQHVITTRNVLGKHKWRAS